MSPTIDRGDQIFTERFTYLVGKPHRYDVVVFQTDALPRVSSHELYVKRLVGLPGDALQVKDGRLCVNGQPCVINGETIKLPKPAMPSFRYLAMEGDAVMVPADHYFLLGDNVRNSMDSRQFGCLPADAVVSRAAFCYLPGSHMGWIR